MIPVSLILLLMVSFFVYFDATGFLWAGSLGATALIYFLLADHEWPPSRRINAFA
jgi:hypothetical protein